MVHFCCCYLTSHSLYVILTLSAILTMALAPLDMYFERDADRSPTKLSLIIFTSVAALAALVGIGGLIRFAVDRNLSSSYFVFACLLMVMLTGTGTFGAAGELIDRLFRPHPWDTNQKIIGLVFWAQQFLVLAVITGATWVMRFFVGTKAVFDGDGPVINVELEEDVSRKRTLSSDVVRI